MSEVKQTSRVTANREILWWKKNSTGVHQNIKLCDTTNAKTTMDSTPVTLKKIRKKLTKEKIKLMFSTEELGASEQKME